MACVKLPATLNIQLELTSFTLGEVHKVCGYHYFFVANYYSLETLSDAIKTVVSAC